VLFIDFICSAVHLSKELAQFTCPYQLIDFWQSITRTMRTEEGGPVEVEFCVAENAYRAILKFQLFNESFRYGRCHFRPPFGSLQRDLALAKSYTP
jgi:hypothetical protein